MFCKFMSLFLQISEICQNVLEIGTEMTTVMFTCSHLSHHSDLKHNTAGDFGLTFVTLAGWVAKIFSF